MKFYSYITWNTHKRDLKYIQGVSEEKKLCIQFVSQIASGFAREYHRIGVLSFNDLVQEGYLALLENWDKIDWEIYYKLPEDEKQPYIWNFIKQGIKWRITDSIKKNRSTIRIPEQYYLQKHGNVEYQTDIFLVQNFSWFFKEAIYMNVIDDSKVTRYSDDIQDDLNELCDRYLSQWEKIVLFLSFGIDDVMLKPMKLADIALKYKVKEGAVRKTKQRALEKLKSCDDIDKIYEKFMQ